MNRSVSIPESAPTAVGPRERSETVSGSRSRLQNQAAGLFWAGLLISTLPPNIRYGRMLWHQELYQYFPFLLAFVVYAAMTRIQLPLRLPVQVSSWSAILAALVLLGLSAGWSSSWIGAVAFVLVAFAFCRSQKDSSGRSLIAVWVPLVMFIRVPQFWTLALMARLQRLTTDLSSRLLDALWIPHMQNGNTLQLDSKSLFVAEACSGVQSLYTVAFLSLALWVWRQRRWMWLPYYVAIACASALAGNVVRVTTIAVVQEWFAWDWSDGWRHECIGYVCLAMAAAWLVALDGWLQTGLGAFEQKRKTRDADTTTVMENSPSGRDSAAEWFGGFDFGAAWSGFGVSHRIATGAAITIASLTVFQLWRNPLIERPVVATNEVLFEPPTDFFQKMPGGLKLQNVSTRRDPHGERESRFGMNSDVWQCGTPSSDGQLALSQPYVGWHELTVCYQALQWKLVNRETFSVGGGPPIVVADFERDGQYGTLIFAGIDSDGALPPVPGVSSSKRLWAPLELLITDDYAEMTGSAQTLMLQYWQTDHRPMPIKTKQHWVDRMSQIRAYTAARVAEQTQRRIRESSS